MQKQNNNKRREEMSNNSRRPKRKGSVKAQIATQARQLPRAERPEYNEATLYDLIQEELCGLPTGEEMIRQNMARSRAHKRLAIIREQNRKIKQARYEHARKLHEEKLVLSKPFYNVRVSA